MVEGLEDAKKVNDTRVFRCNPTNAVGGAFILSLHGDTGRASPNPTNAVGGIIGTNVDEALFRFSAPC